MIYNKHINLQYFGNFLPKYCFYVQAENPISIHGYRKGWDPEINTDGSQYYPILSTYTFGVNLKF